MGTQAGKPAGYSKPALDAWAQRAAAWAAGDAPQDLPLLAKPAARRGREVFLYVISGAKALNPAAATALIERLTTPTSSRA